MKLKSIKIAMVCGLSFALNAQAQILPDNNLGLLDDVDTIANITEEQFTKAVDDAAGIYKSLIEAHGGELVTNKLWTNSTVNASAQQSGKKWIINMYGGLARRPEITLDGFVLVICHELGHHLGGFSFYDNGWAADEGQADYFATQSCAHESWKSDHEQNAKARETVKPAAKELCDKAWSTESEQNLCYRSAMAGESLAVLLGALGGSTVPKFETPDATVVTTTNHRHPKAQCRLDTYFSGALCQAGFDPKIIPGRKHPDGQNSEGAELDASKASCTKLGGYELGMRPSCWFKARI